MSDDDRPTEPQDDEPTTEPPPAVQWMLQQAAAGQSTVSMPANLGESPATALVRVPSEAILAERRQRIAGALRGNERLTAGLPDEPAEALMQLGLHLAGVVIGDTAGLDDAAAEDILQPRVRAVRRLMISVAAATSAAASPETADWVEQSALVLGDRFMPPNRTDENALGDEWRLWAGKPAEQIAVLRRFIESHTGR